MGSDRVWAYGWAEKKYIEYHIFKIENGIYKGARKIRDFVELLIQGLIGLDKTLRVQKATEQG